MRATLMKTVLIFSVALLATLMPGLERAQAQGGGVDFLELAIETKANIAERFAACGTLSYDARDPRLPQPLVPAHAAYANLSRGWLAGYYYRENGWGVQQFIYKRPNGGKIAWMELNEDRELAFYTSLGGIQARMVKYYTPAGVGIYFLCQSQYVSEMQFRQCVEWQFVRPLLGAFCI
jgi:hypothetical protein